MKRIYGHFEYAIDWLNAFIRGIAMYFLALTFNFWGYQDGNGVFQPLLCMLIFVCSFEVVVADRLAGGCNMDGVFNKRNILLLLTVAFNFILSRFITASKTSFFLISLLPAADNFLTGYRLRNEKDAAAAMRNKYVKRAAPYGAALCLISLWAAIGSEFPTAEYPVSVDRCMDYFYVWFIVYLALAMLLKYVNMQYRHLGKYTGCNSAFIKRQIQVDLILGVFILVIFLPVIIVVRNTVIVGIGMFIIRFFLSLFNLGLSFVSEELLKRLTNMFSMSASVQAVSTEGGGMMLSAKSLFNPAMIILTAVVVIIAVLILISFLRLYKVKGAQYKGESQESVFVEPQIIKELEVREVIVTKAVFPKDAKGRIRKYYYRYMNGRIPKHRLSEAYSNTPGELADNYAEHDDKSGVQSITEAYEKARYSNDEAGSRDVLEMKELFKKLSGR